MTFRIVVVACFSGDGLQPRPHQFASENGAAFARLSSRGGNAQGGQTPETAGTEPLARIGGGSPAGRGVSRGAVASGLGGSTDSDWVGGGEEHLRAPREFTEVMFGRPRVSSRSLFGRIEDAQIDFFAVGRDTGYPTPSPPGNAPISASTPSRVVDGVLRYGGEAKVRNSVVAPVAIDVVDHGPLRDSPVDYDPRHASRPVADFVDSNIQVALVVDPACRLACVAFVPSFPDLSSGTPTEFSGGRRVVESGQEKFSARIGFLRAHASPVTVRGERGRPLAGTSCPRGKPREAAMPGGSQPSHGPQNRRPVRPMMGVDPPDGAIASGAGEWISAGHAAAIVLARIG